MTATDTKLDQPDLVYWVEQIIMMTKGIKLVTATIVLPGMEPTGHYWFNLGAFLQDNGMKPVHVNPHHVHKSKELDDNNPSKDPKTIAALVNEGRFNYPYIPTGVYAEIRSLYGLQVMTQEALIRVKNRIARWLSIYFPEYKDVYRSSVIY